MARSGNDWKSAVVARVRTDANKQWEGKSIAGIAIALNKPESDTVADLLLEEGGGIGMVYFAMNAEDVKLAMQRPWVSVGSDGRALNSDPNSRLSSGKPHPRSYGTFPRVPGRYARERKVVLTLENDIREITSLAAQQMASTTAGCCTGTGRPTWRSLMRIRSSTRRRSRTRTSTAKASTMSS